MAFLGRSLLPPVTLVGLWVLRSRRLLLSTRLAVVLLLLARLLRLGKVTSPCRFPSPKGVGTCPVNTVRTRRAPCAPSGGCVSTLGVGLGFSVDLDPLTTTITANVVYARSMVSLGMRSLCDRRPLVNRNNSMARLASLTLSGNLFGSSFLLLSGLMLIASSVKLTPLVNLGILFIGALDVRSSHSRKCSQRPVSSEEA